MERVLPHEDCDPLEDFDSSANPLELCLQPERFSHNGSWEGLCQLIACVLVPLQKPQTPHL